MPPLATIRLEVSYYCCVEVEFSFGFKRLSEKQQENLSAGSISKEIFSVPQYETNVIQVCPTNMYNFKNLKIMKELNLESMSVVRGGGGIACALSTVSLIAAIAGLFALTVATGGVALVVTVFGAIVAPTSFGLSCFT